MAVLRTDHASLTWLLNFKEPEGQLARWMEALQSYDMEMQHRAGRLHSNTDALSRRPCEEADCRHCQCQEERDRLTPRVATTRTDETVEGCLSAVSDPEWQAAQADDPS